MVSETQVLASNGEEAAKAPPAKFIETIDPEDPDYRRELQRPADVKEDMRQMESRQRVSSILNSQAFRDELESIIADQLKHGPHPASLIALQQISELLLPNAASSRWHTLSTMSKVSSTELGNLVVPINDIRGIDSANYTKGERLTRCKFASLYRLIDLFGWNNSATLGQLNSVRLNSELEHLLVNPHGLMFNEVSASSLVKCALDGTSLEHGSTTYGINKPLLQLHGAIYRARPDIRCVLHVHSSITNAISSLKNGLLPICQEAVVIGNVSYHEYRGVGGYDETAVKKLLSDELGPVNKVMFVRNYGLVACGETIEEAWFYLLNAIAACETQLRLMPAGLDNIHVPNEETRRRLAEVHHAQLSDLNASENKRWRLGEIEFEACMRCLDNASYRTGYIYRQPVMRQIDRTAVKDIEIPPHCSTLSFDQEYVRKLKEERQKLCKGSDWLTTPNVYSKTELEETGPFAKKVTKWVSDGTNAASSPNKTSTPIRIENKHQFAPQGSDPKELKNHQKQIKQDRYEDKKTPGHQSKILIGVDGAEGGSELDSPAHTNGHSSHHATPNHSMNGHFSKERFEASTNENGVIQTQVGSSPNTSQTYVYGAVSKGIIKRDQQNNSHVYKTVQSPANPFQQSNERDLEKYKKDVAQRQLKDQVQRKDDMHRELLDKSTVTVTTIDAQADLKKKSNTLPRSKSLLDKKNDTKDEDSITDKLNSSVGVVNGQSQVTAESKEKANKSATLSTSSVAQHKEESKAKKKSKIRSFSFLKSKKSKESPNTSSN